MLLSTISSDAHTWNLVFLQLLLEESGCEVINLGPCVPDELLRTTAECEQPDAIVISSVNGHARTDGCRVARVLRATVATRHIPLMIGGKLGISGAVGQDAVQDLLRAGFDFVFEDSCDPAVLPERIAELGSPGLLPGPAARTD
ncbi:methylmalonyl-CoA mutase cobalamin-binding subunit [Amycolatopsis bartoniae]|uniref:Methylaspartate mutase n=1 Tax=Amycolatopsis bartoniae TaxID=941986 RepID=A0A8H9IUJ8_9PSEU|nr:cobalamin-dependent protein [Amycolatopsis bartoniae]MBB2940211.1 methylmalonyl-CoA mutase cobalamin-binding subunit [Amycolatopsis bartoniae]GHF66441.1 methylaspartate mutase [Amycolatopsis bartoniae]